jgi:cystathionine beta-lyase/cystathionine gamma-synthase
VHERTQRLATKVIHAGEPKPRILGAVNMPVFLSSTYEYGGEESYHDIRYVRLSNSPNHKVLHEKLAALENAEAAVVAASGMAAITTTLFAMLAPGDHLLALEVLYGGTFEFVTRELPRLGIAVDLIDKDRPDNWKHKLRPTTRAIYVETITNPLMQVPDLAGVVRFAREHHLVSIVDNTFATPVNFRPAEHGFDLSVHSGTKYLNGHTDNAAGAVIGRADLVKKVLHKLNLLGGSLDPHACFLLHRGLKTLAVRVRHQNESAMRLASFLALRPEIAAVHYPGLPDHPDHHRASEWFEGCGGMLSFELAGDAAAVDRFLGGLTIPIIAPSLGGTETLVTQPARTSHSGLSAEERRRSGISDGLIRVSIGLEDPEDLIEDFSRALDAVG